MTHLPSDFEQKLLADEPDFDGCIEGEDFTMRIAECLPYQLGLTFEWIREHVGLRAEDISIIDGVALRMIVSGCVLQYKRGGELDLRYERHMDIPFEAAERWLHDRFDADVLTLQRISPDIHIRREYLRRKMSDVERV